MFPVLLLTAFLVERIAQYLLGYFPSYEFLWMVSFELREFYRELANIFASYMNHTMFLQVSFLIAAMTSCLLLARRNMLKSLFLLNHFGLLVVGIASLTTSNSVVSANGSEILGNAVYRFSSVQLSWLHVTFIVIGIISCIIMHIIYVTDSARRVSQISTNLNSLKLDL